MAKFNIVLFMALVAMASCQLYEKDTTPSSGWFGGIFHSGDKSASSLPESAEWSTEIPSSTPSSLWSYLSFGHHTTPSSLLRLRRAAQGQYPYRPYRPYNRYPNQAYNRGWNQGGNRPYYQRPIETTTQARDIYMPGNGPDMPVASSTFTPQFGLGVTYKNGATVKPTTSTANPAAAWYQNWLNSLPDSLKSLYGVTTTVSPQGLVGRRRRSAEDSSSTDSSLASELATSTESTHHHYHHHHHDESSSSEPSSQTTGETTMVPPKGLVARRRRSVEDFTSTESRLSPALELSTESTTLEDDSSSEASSTAKAIHLKRRAADETLGSSPSPMAMIAIEGQETTTAGSQHMKLSGSTPSLR